MNQKTASLMQVIDAPTATVVVDRGEGRRFLAELTLGAVATYLALKYIDGFIEGVGAVGRETLPDPEKRWSKVIEYSKSMPANDVPSFLTADALFGERLRENLQMFLLTMASGRGS